MTFDLIGLTRSIDRVITIAIAFVDNTRMVIGPQGIVQRAPALKYSNSNSAVPVRARTPSWHPRGELNFYLKLDRLSVFFFLMILVVGVGLHGDP